MKVSYKIQSFLQSKKTKTKTHTKKNPQNLRHLKHYQSTL